ncbi:MAG: protein kinase, partial [Gemmatimonadota bacterium]
MAHAVARLNAALAGRYEIERELGEGGMATVYLAKDLKHNRSVALKVLKPELAAVVGAERFLAEIETTANLQHPHILPLFDSGEVDNILFYVMPYVEGETLADRLAREKQLPVSEAVAIATSVAGALQVAHDHGVIHRDIKPGNILISRGQPLVADFGIALAVGAAGGNRLTETGLSVGTPYYMSPEQATGDQSVGPASDTYALACVLYEMLIGEPPYLGNTAQAVLGKIIQGQPVSVSGARKAVPDNVDAAIRKGLEKLPADRFRHAEDFAHALADPSFRHGTAVGSGTPSGVWNRVTVGFAALTAVLAVALAASLLLPATPTPASVKRFEIDIGPTAPLGSTNIHVYPVLSPDGTSVAYSASTGGGTARLHVRRVDQLEARVLPGTENAYQPFFSPDGQWIAYFDPLTQQLKKVSVQGGQPLVIAYAYPPLGGTWLDDGSIVYTTLEKEDFSLTGVGAALFRVPDAGGTPERLTTVDAQAGEVYHGFPQILPDGETLIYSVMGTGAGEGQVVARSLATGDERPLLGAAYMARYAASGHLVFARQGAIWAVPFDAGRREIAGQEVVVLQGVEMTPYAVPYSLSPDGLLVYMPGGALEAEGSENTVPRSFVWVDREGNEDPLRLPVRQYEDPRLSPDGTQVAVAVFDGRVWDLWSYDVRTGAGLRLTHVDPPGDGVMVPVWTADGQRVIYRSLSAAGANDGDLYWVRADGSGAPEPLVVNDASNDHGTSLTADGRTLIYSSLLGG